MNFIKKPWSWAIWQCDFCKGNNRRMEELVCGLWICGKCHNENGQHYTAGDFVEQHQQHQQHHSTSQPASQHQQQELKEPSANSSTPPPMPKRSPPINPDCQCQQCKKEKEECQQSQEEEAEWIIV